MTSSLQQIEAALAHVQLPSPEKDGRSAAPLRMVNHAMNSCSFDIESDFGKPKAATSLAQVEPPAFCKPLRRVAAKVPQQSVSMLVSSAKSEATAQASMLVKGALDAPTSPLYAAVEPAELGHFEEEHVELDPAAIEVTAQAEAVSDAPVSDDAPASDDGRSLEDDNTAEAERPVVNTVDIAAAGPKITAMKVKAIETGEVPELPRSKAPKFKTHRNYSNPMLPLGLLQDIGKEVLVWQTQLKDVHDSIQSLYAEGPIVNAWLESMAEGAKSAAPVGAVEAAKGAPELTMAGRYCVCGLDKSGQVWRKLCPPDQLPQVSMAIARHQKLRQLLSQKQSIDSRLQRLAQTLTVLRGRLRAY